MSKLEDAAASSTAAPDCRAEPSPLPAPPVDADANLQSFPYFPLYRRRLFASSFHALANDAEWRAGLTLMLQSQDQIPAGSLPDDDAQLAYLAGFGRSKSQWQRVRAMALRGWYKASDGRLYHQVVTEVILFQLQLKAANKARTEAARQKRLSQAMSQHGDEPVTDNVAGHAASSKGNQRKWKSNSTRNGSNEARSEWANYGPPAGWRHANFDERDAWLEATGKGDLAGDYGHFKYPKYVPADWFMPKPKP